MLFSLCILKSDVLILSFCSDAVSSEAVVLSLVPRSASLSARSLPATPTWAGTQCMVACLLCLTCVSLLRTACSKGLFARARARYSVRSVVSMLSVSMCKWSPAFELSSKSWRASPIAHSSL